MIHLDSFHGRYLRKNREELYWYFIPHPLPGCSDSGLRDLLTQWWHHCLTENKEVLTSAWFQPDGKHSRDMKCSKKSSTIGLYYVQSKWFNYAFPNIFQNWVNKGRRGVNIFSMVTWQVMVFGFQFDVLHFLFFLFLHSRSCLGVAWVFILFCFFKQMVCIT